MKLTILIVYLFVPLISMSQNIVPNGDFEETDTCGELIASSYWQPVTYTPDYYNSCYYYFNNSTPYNLFGYQIPASGEGYVGLYFKATGTYREVLATQLISPLITGETYYVEYKISPSMGNPNITTGSCNKVGIKFSMALPTSNITPNNYSHVYTNNIYSDSSIWSLVSQTFIADSNYQYIQIGNFFDNNNTSSIGGNYAYYYVDDICVSTNLKNNCSSLPTGLGENTNENSIILFPNPTCENTTMVITAKEAGKAQISISNISGKLISEKNYTIVSGKNSISIPLDNISNGYYFVNVKTQGEMTVLKLLKE